MKADVVIVGSGITGLTAGALLSKKGKDVVIVEKQTSLGGALRQFRRNKIAYDVGFHYTGCLGQGEILDILWRYCEVLPEISVVSLSAKGYDHFEFRDRETPVRGYFSYGRFAAELKHHFPSEKRGIDRYFSEIRKICSEVPFYNTKFSLTAFLRGYKSRPRSLAAFLYDITENIHLRAILSTPAFLYGVPIVQASLEVHALVAHGYYSGAYTVAGGGQSIVDSFVSTLTRQGVKLFSGSDVISIETDNGVVAGVELAGGERISCSQVIYTGHPAHIVDMVPGSLFRPAYRTRLKELKNSLSMFAVFGRGDRRLDTLNGPLNYYLLPGEGEIIPESCDTPHHLRPMMLTGTRGWKGESLQGNQNGIILLRLGYWQDVCRFEKDIPGRRSDNYEEYKAEIAREMIHIAEERWGNICGKIDPLAVGTPLTFRDELAAPEGCAYGAMHCLDQFNPDVRTRLPGLYLCGQSILMSGVAGASISGLVGAGEILGLEALWEEVKKCN